MINTSMDALVWLRKQLETDDNDLLREMVRSFAQELMSADADAACNASYGEFSCHGDRTNITDSEFAEWRTILGRDGWVGAVDGESEDPRP